MGGHWVLLANPAAGGGRGRKMAERAAARLQEAGRPVDMRLTRAPGHGTEVARQAVAEGAARLLVCGGDGTIRETLPALQGSPTALGLLPFGTANDLARALGIPRRLDRAVQTLLAGQEHPLDLGRMGEHFFATVAAFGFDAEISQAMASGRIPLPGTAGYLLATLQQISAYSPPRIVLRGDFGHIEQEVLLVATGNTDSYGGGMKIAPGADPGDGLFDVCIIGRVSRLTVARMLPRLFTGGHVGHPAVRLERTRFLEIATDEPRILYADGEYLGRTPVRLETAPAALRVIRPLPAP